MQNFVRLAPKPVLFGMFGALGGVLGAVLLGEYVWGALKPPPPPIPPPEMALTASPAVQLYVGGNNTLTARVAVGLPRDPATNTAPAFAGVATLSFDGVPSGVKLTPSTCQIADNVGDVELTVTADKAAAPGQYELQITAVVSANGHLLGESTAVTLQVNPLPPPQMALTASPSVSVYAGETNTFGARVAIGLARLPQEETAPLWTGSAKFSVDGLPAGVKVPGKICRVENSVGVVDLVVTADESAKPGTWPIRLESEVTIDGQPLQRSTELSVTVKPLPLASVDVMFVLDTSGSMQEEINGVRDGIGDFANRLSRERIAWRLGLLSFRNRITGEESRLHKFGQSPFTTNVDQYKRSVESLAAAGGGGIGESSLDALLESSRQPFRSDSTRVLILITDEPPELPDREAQTIGEVVDELKVNRIHQLHLVVSKNLESVFTPLQKGTESGEYFELDRVANGQNGFAALLPKLGTAIVEATQSVAPEEPPSPVPDTPQTQPSLAAPKKASPAPPVPRALGGLQSTQRFAQGTSGRLLLAVSAWSALVAAFICVTLQLGQHHYLTSTMLPLQAAVLGLVGGTLAGLAGGVSGQGLFTLTSAAPSIEGVFRVVGWAVLGGLAGFGLSFFIPNLHRLPGVAGGVAGGTLGACGFLILANFGGSDAFGRVAGAAQLGLCIGVMVACVERAFRKAWLIVRWDTGERVEVNLGLEPVRIGSGAGCTVRVDQIADAAVRYLLRGEQIICYDSESKREVVVPDRNTRRVGPVEVQVRSNLKSKSTAPIVSPAPPPPPVRHARPTSSSLSHDVTGRTNAKPSAGETYSAAEPQNLPKPDSGPSPQQASTPNGSLPTAVALQTPPPPPPPPRRKP